MRKKQEIIKFKTSSQHLGGFNWRIFVETGECKFSLVIQTANQPRRIDIVNIWKEHNKQFFIEI